MRIYHTKELIFKPAPKWDDISVDLDCICVARAVDNNTQVYTCYGSEYIIKDEFNEFIKLWKGI